MRGVNDRIVLAWRRCNASKLGSVNDNVTEERGVAPLAGPLVLYICAATICRDITLFQIDEWVLIAAFWPEGSFDFKVYGAKRSK